MARPTPYLHGNHYPCPSCALRREIEDAAPIIRDPIPCNRCGGAGYLPLPVAEIIAMTCRADARGYWQAFDRACGNPRTPYSMNCDQGASKSRAEDGEAAGCGG